MSSVKVSVSIVVYKNDPETLKKAIKSVLNSNLSTRLVIVDNSPKNTLAHLCTNEGVIYIHNNKNVGFGAGHNIALKHSGASEFHLILNPDIYFDENVLSQLVEYMNVNPRIGLLSPKVCFPSGEPQYLCRRYPSVFALFLRRFSPDAVKNMFSNYLDHFDMKDVGYEFEMDIPCATGCFMFYRKNILQELDGFDERFFLYFEDIDLSYRTFLRSTSRFNPNIKVFHYWERGSYKSVKLAWMNTVSAFKFFNKHGWKIW